MARTHPVSGGGSPASPGLGGKQPLKVNPYVASAGGSQGILRLGSSGEAVVDLQGRLLKAGLYKDKIDGRYGSKTVEAVKLFQKSMGLAADGIVGATTWAALNAGKTPGGLLPVLVAESKRKPGLNDDGTVANDMRCGDYTKEQIERLSFMFRVDDFTVGLDTVSAKTLFDSLRFMSTSLFATGELEGNIQRMIDRFESNTGATYSDAVLTRAVREHASTQRFVEQIRKGLAEAIKKHNGDIGKLTKNLDVKLIGRPVFNSKSDTVSGLTIAINDTWAYKVAITNYELSGKRYKGTFSVTLYDHFGLDQPDVEKFYKFGAGFRAWFILQHLKRFAYKPFITEVEMTYSFEGQLA